MKKNRNAPLLNFTRLRDAFIAARSSMCACVCSSRNTCHNRKTPLVILYEKLFTQWQERHAPGVRNAGASQGAWSGERAAGRRRIEKAALFPSPNSEQVESPEHPCPLKPHVNATSKTHGHWAVQRKL